MLECVSELLWCFFKQDYLLFAEGASYGDVPFKHKEHTLWRKVSAYWSCIAIFQAEVCFVCFKDVSHRDVSFEHTDNAFLWEIISCIP